MEPVIVNYHEWLKQQPEGHIETGWDHPTGNPWRPISRFEVVLFWLFVAVLAVAWSYTLYHWFMLVL